ncbi:hypothetical protein [Patulibacter minatonensis]|uniref:hypothetical protein n=1 Tax=Patulibacter minatonensis TaxID=298163 RepID=UPI0004B16BFD|nr:hypothetical protein [Patulibacter minatonensis]
MSPLVRRVGLLALLLGVLGGAVAAAAIPGERTAAATSGRAGAGREIRVAAARPQRHGSAVVGLRRTGRFATAARVDDPAGGAPWVLRTFLAERFTTVRSGTHVVGRNRCFQLGRLHRGRFGWIDGHDVFRPVTAGYRGAPIDCGSRLPDLHREPAVQAFHPLRTAAGTQPSRTGTVVWGSVGVDGRALDLRLDGESVRTTRGRYGGLLSVRTDDPDAATLTGSVRYPTGGPVPIGGGPRLPDRFLRGLKAQPDPDAATFVAARAADPNGGLPFGLAARPATGGGHCVASQPGRIVQDRVGRIDFELGTFTEQRIGRESCQSIGYVGRTHPIGIGYGGADEGGEPSADPAPGRVARRTLPGMEYFAGQLAPDVRSLTLSSPRDVRTLLPSSPAHAYLVVYDGTIDSGTMRFSARMADGSSHEESAPLGF